MHALEAFIMGKDAEVSNTPLMPATPPPGRSGKDTSPTKTIPKTGAAPEQTGEVLELGAGVAGESAQRAPQAAPVRPHVDVSTKEPPKRVETKEAQYFALPSHRRYPLDSYAQVKTACSYFAQWSGQMAPVHRREYCVNLVKRASQLGIPVPELAEHYGAPSYASAAVRDAAIDARCTQVKTAELRSVLEDLRQAPSGGLSGEPDDYALVLEEFDKYAGLDHLYADGTIPDPWLSTFGKVAEATDSVASSPEGSIVVGNDYITSAQLKNFALTNLKTIVDVFGLDFAQEFRKDPTAIFNSLPMDQKKFVIRMVTDNAPRDRSSA